MVKIRIDNTVIGDNCSCYTVAEAGANHDGTLEKAIKLIDGAKKAKASSIKFQTYKASALTTKNAPKYWVDDSEDKTQYDVFKKLDHLKKDDWKAIFEYAAKSEITCFSTPFDEESANLLYSLGVPAFKIASADLTHLPLIRHVASKKLPIFISTGMGTEQEIDEAVHCIQDTGNNEIIILHCMTSYPTQPADANLVMIRSLKKRFPDYIIGYSDHTLGVTVAEYSYFYGARVIEKHFTFDKKLLDSPDHRLSLDVEGFRELVDNLKIAEISSGNPVRDNFNCEIESVKYARRSIVSKTKIKKGTIISKDMIAIKRPATGIYPKFMEQVIGSKVIRDIEEDNPIQWDDITNN